MLNLLISTQMAKDPSASGSIRQQSIGNEAVNVAGHVIFAAGPGFRGSSEGSVGPLDNGCLLVDRLHS